MELVSAPLYYKRGLGTDGLWASPAEQAKYARLCAPAEEDVIDEDETSRDEQLVPTFVRSEDVTDEELARRAATLVVPPPMCLTREHFTPENLILKSSLEYRDFAWTFRHAYNHMTAVAIPAQWAEMSFIVNGNRHDFVGVGFTLPTIRGQPLFPAYSRAHRDAPYSAREHPVERITDLTTGASRTIRHDIGLLPVMLGTNLCNLHSSNRRRAGSAVLDSTQLAPPVNFEADEIRGNTGDAAGERLRARQQREQRDYYRLHNESTTDKIPMFILGGTEHVGVTFDKQRNSVIQPVREPRRRVFVRFIAMGTKTSNNIVFFNDRVRTAEKRKRGGVLPTVQLHVSNFMRNSMDDNHINILVPFHLFGWDCDRVLHELRPFLPADEFIWQRVKLEMAATIEEFNLIVAGGTLYEVVRTEMRNKGMNPATQRAFTPVQITQRLFFNLFRHMNCDYSHATRDGMLDAPDFSAVNERKLLFLLMMLGELWMCHIGVVSTLNRNCPSRKKFTSLVCQMQNLHMRHLIEARRQWIVWLKGNPLGPLDELSEQAYVDAVRARFDISKTFERSMTGKSWGLFLPNGQCKPAACQPHEKLRRDSLYCSLSQGNRTRKHVNPQVKMSDPRDFDPLGHGAICGLETPDGVQSGLAEHKTISSIITVKMDDAFIRSLLRRGDMLSARADPARGRDAVILCNGNFLGYGAWEVEPFLRRMKRLGVIDNFTAIAAFHEPIRKIMICTDEGRLMVPLMVVCEETGEVLAHRHMPGERDFMRLLRAGYIEYVDPLERRTKQVSFDYADLVSRTREASRVRQLSRQRLADAEAAYDVRSWTAVAHLALCRRQHEEIMRFSRVDYVDMDPCTQLGITAALIPMLQKDYAVRTGYLTGLFKQTIGAYVSNIRARTDVNAKELMYGSMPGYHTVVDTIIGRQAYHAFALTIMISTDPYTQEDALVVNARAVEAGMGSFWTLKGKEVDEDENVRFGIAPGARGFRRKYRNILESGMPRRGAIIREDEVLVARTAYGTVADDYHMPHGECGTVQAVEIIRDGPTDLRRVFILIRRFRTLGVGYKATNLAGQKATYGDVRAHVDMPQVYAHPERVIQQIGNPIPTCGRVTLASMDELKFAKAYGLDSSTMNATPFARYNPSHLERVFIEHGLRPNGMEEILLPDGHRAAQRVFVGRMVYMCLAHIPDDKVHVRSTGPVQVQTGQPLQGRMFKGGLLFGIMELAQLMNHGASAQITERLMLHSDKGFFILCRVCRMRYDTLFFRGARCRNCFSRDFCKLVFPTVLRYMENILSIINVDFQITFFCPDRDEAVRPAPLADENAAAAITDL